MTPNELIQHYGTQQKAATAIGVTQGAVSQWVSAGGVPWDRQLQVEHMTGGALKHDPGEVPEHIRDALRSIPAPSQEAAA